MSHLIAPSLLSADFSNLKKDIEIVNKSDADWFHLDIMDGVFVPNISFGIPVVRDIKKHAKKPLDVHLMITNPDKYFSDFKKAGADIISFHYEASDHLHKSIQELKDLGIKAGVAINPHTNVLLLEDIICDVDMILIMSVNPGFGGQKFIENTYDKIKKLKNIIHSKNSNALIQVDGGVNLDNAPKLFNAGADILVAGNTVFSSDDPISVIQELKG